MSLSAVQANQNAVPPFYGPGPVRWTHDRVPSFLTHGFNQFYNVVETKQLWGVSIPCGVTPDGPLVGNRVETSSACGSVPHDLLPYLLLASLTAWTLVSPESTLTCSCLASLGLWARCPTGKLSHASSPATTTTCYIFSSFSHAPSDLWVSLFSIKDLILRIPDPHNSLYICRYPCRALPERSVSAPCMLEVQILT